MPTEALPIPAPDALPLPAPGWLLQALLLFTFILHLLPMNVVLGGGLVAGVSSWWARRTGNEHLGELARGLITTIPYVLAATVTTGVAPLLFLQVLYGPFYYTSSILMAVPWLAVVGMLILSYYGFYRNAFLVKDGRRASLRLLWASALLVVVIALLYTSNMTLMLTPEKWRDVYSPHGLYVHLADASVIPRFLHFVVASVAVTGVSIALRGLFVLRTDDSYGRWLVGAGSLVFIVATGVQFLVGVAFLFSLPSGWRGAFLGGDPTATGLLIAAVLLALAAMGCLLLAVYARRPGLPTLAGPGALLLTIVLMVLMRDKVRRMALDPHIAPLQEEPQWGVLAVFFVLLIGAAGVVLWMMSAVVRARQRTE